MDDAMLDLTADHGELRRRLDGYAAARLTPDLAASSRMRARVLAVAHRQSSIARADATLALVADPGEATTSTRSRSSGRSRTVRRGATLLVAAALAAGAMSSVALAAQPGGGLYGARVWAETLTLPTSPRERAVAELVRLDERLAEITSATARGDDGAARAALAAYETILESAAASALLSDDAIALLTIEEGAKHNITVLSALAAILPDRASHALEQALQRAIDRGTETVNGIDDDTVPNGGGDGNGVGPHGNGAGGNGAGPAATPDPTTTPKPTKEPKATDTPKATATPKPTRTPTPTAVAQPEPTAHVPPARPTPRPTPDRPEPPGGGGGGESTGPGGNDAGEESRPTPRGQGD